MGPFAAAEHDYDAHLVPVFQEPLDVVDLGLEIMVLDLDPVLGGLHLLLTAAPAGVLLMLLQFVAVLAIVPHLRDGGLGLLPYEYQIKLGVSRLLDARVSTIPCCCTSA